MEKKEENPKNKGKETVPDGIIREVAVGKGLSEALRLFRDQGSLKDTNGWSGRKVNKKKINLAGDYDDEGQQEIQIEKRDEFGHIMDEKEAYKEFCYTFHGKRPSSRTQERRMRRFQEEMKVKKSRNNEDMLSMENILRVAQKPYLVLDGNKSSARNSFTAVAQGIPGGQVGDGSLVKRQPKREYATSSKRIKT